MNAFFALFPPAGLWPGFLCSTGLFFGFANPVLHFPPLIFLYLAGLNLFALNGSSLAQVFRYSLVGSGLAFSIGLYWIVVPVHEYGGLPFLAALGCPVLLGFVLGFFSCLYCSLVYCLRDTFSRFQLGLFAGCTWAAFEFLREYIFTGFPWFILAQSIVVWPESVQFVRLAGSTGLAMIMCTACMWLMSKTPRLVAAGFFLLVLVMGYGYVKPPESEPERWINVLAVQGNISQDLKWEKESQKLTVNKYFALTRKGLDKYSPDLVLWPETALPFYFQESTELALAVRDFVRENSLDLITGSPAYVMHRDGNDYTLYNRAFWVSKDGQVQDYYDKERLVPFGEYIPFSSLLPFVDKLVAGELDLSKGVQTRPMSKDNLDLGTLICYEVIFPGLVRKRVAQGADILINISNDAWFGNTSAPMQHLHLSALRAVEQNRYLVRATNTGISAFIDPSGLIYSQSGLFTEVMLGSRAGLKQEKTLYFHLYPWLDLFFCFVVLSVLVFYFLRVRSRGGS